MIEAILINTAQFIIWWFIYLAMMMLDNIFWMNKGGEWWGDAIVENPVTRKSWTGPVKDYSFADKLEYILNYRLVTVLTSWRDLIPSAIFALGTTLFI